MRKFQKIIVSLFLIAAIVSAAWATENLAQSNSDTVSQVLKLIKTYYYNESSVDFQKLQDAAIEAIIANLGGHFTYYFSPSEAKEFSIQTSSQYGGIGTEVTFNATSNAIEVISPMYDSPAEKAGIKSGDLITSIDGTSVKALGYVKAVDALRGTPGSTVTIQLYRPSDKATMTLTLKRSIIELKTVKSTTFEASGTKIGYIRITNFSETTSSDFNSAFAALLNQHIQGLILDLRDDPGGLFTAALDVASQFLPQGKLIITMRDKNGYEYPFKSAGGLDPKIPVVVLVNNGSASSSEIVSAALRDNDIGVLVGERTFGKAAVQTEFQLSNGGLLLLVTDHYFTPNGQDINLKGIEPDYVVSSGATPTEAESYKQLIQSVVMSTQSTAKINLSDPQFQKAVEILVGEIKAGVTFPKNLK
ncbi:MAG: S41 family peptidase [Thermotogae bacterium]|jgi:carboxyl-terminal processing protease|nr:S41 family peptidase [Thermotogota bacterium]MCL5033192.1 S41 family peptidase [Thermotogota bacterium]